MEDETLEFLSGGTEDTSAAHPAGSEPQTAPEPVETASPPPAPRPPEPGHVPLSAVLDERERRQAAEARLAEYEALQREALVQAQQAELPPAERVEQALYAQNLRASRRFAEREYGRDAISALHDWAVARCDADPFFNQQMLASEDPYEAARQAWQSEQVLARVRPSDLGDYEAWRTARAASAAQGSPPGGFPQQPAPPRSLANAPNAGGSGLPEVQFGPGAAHASLFRK
ncbi:MAG: hypothetical protein JO111_11765 [Caulobacteraceae bacterium]|nr:hypothetical protein [Caulobacteraceae bacterium]